MPVTLISPYIDCAQWLRGNLHAHTTVSDGACPAEEVIADYERRGYDFLAISDHDKFVPPEDYQDRTRMTLIGGVETSANGPHILHVEARTVVEPVKDRQVVLDEIRRQGGFAVLNHPNWQAHFDHFPQALMEALEGYAGVEIYNGVIERLEGTALATDRWDRLLGIGRRVWGFAHDDSHRPGDVGLAWNVVQSEDRGAGAIVVALRQGRFYASTGVTIRKVAVEGTTVRVETEDAQRIRFVSRLGVIRATADSPEASFTLPEDEAEARRLLYVRAECYGSGGRCAWTQPIFIS
jgi:hypothetical protein